MLAEAQISIPRITWQLPLPPLASSFSISIFFHGLVLTGGLFWAGAASRTYVGPSEFELVGLDAAFQAGVERRERKASVSKGIAKSKLDEAVTQQKRPEQSSARVQDDGPAQKASSGSAGKAAANVGTQSDIWQRYGAGVRQAILDKFRYPPASRSMGETGRVKVAFAVLPDGSLTEVRLVSASAFERLNQAAVAMVATITKVEPLPQTGLPRWDTEIAIDFKLN